MIQRMILGFCLFVCPLLGDVTIGSKNFTEQLILGEMFAQLIEHNTDIPVHRKLNLSGSYLCFEALLNERIDIYPEYVGSGLVSVLKLPPESDSEKAFRTVQREFYESYGMIWGKPLGFNNTACLLVRGDDPLFVSAEKISDLKDIDQHIVLGAPHEFLERPDGYPLIQGVYNVNFPGWVGLEPGLMYSALKSEDVNVIAAFSTDPRIDAWGLKILEDDQQGFPAYDAAPLYTQALNERHPDISPLLHQLHNQISEEKMRKMSYLVDIVGIPPESVAREFLINKNLITGELSRASVSSTGHFLPYMWEKRGDVALRVWQHLALSLTALTLAALIGIPLAFFLTRFPATKGLVMVVINIFQTIPSLALLGFLIPLIGIGYAAAIIALFFYALLPIVRSTYVGVRGINPNIIEASRGIGLTDLQILFRVELPLSLRMIIAGLRTSTMIIVGTATLAALIGAGGLGEPIFRGISSVNFNMILLGAIPAAGLAISLDLCFHFIESQLISKGLKTPTYG